MSNYYFKKQILIKTKDKYLSAQLYAQKDDRLFLRINSLIKKTLKEYCDLKKISVNDFIDILIRQELFNQNISIEPKKELIYGKDWEL